MFIRFALLLIFLLPPLQAHGHKIHTFAWVSGDTVTVESGFFGNHPLINGKVSVKNKQSGETILEGISDNKGVFTFTIPAIIKRRAEDLLITVSGGEGHQAEWLLPASEYLSDDSISILPQKQTVDGEELRKIVQEVLEQELAPIKRNIARAADQKPGFRDTMGGIGYLLGLAGLVAWLRNRKTDSSKNQ